MASVEFHNLWSFDNQRQLAASAKCGICQESLSYFGDNLLCPKCKMNADFSYGTDLLLKEHVCCKSDKEIVAYCFHCSTDLCEICVMEHQYMKHFENHNVLHFNKSSSPGNSSPVMTNPLICCLHKSEVLRYFCKTCSTLICEQCAASEHPKETHDYDYVEQDLKIKLKQEVTRKSEAKMNQLKVMEKLVENQCSQLQEQYIKVQTDIKEAFCFFYSVIEDRKEQLLKELEHLYTKKMLPLTLVGSQVSESLKMIEMPSVDIDQSLIHSDASKGNSFLERLNPDDLTELVKKITTQSMDLEFSSNYQAIKIGVHDMFGFIHTKSHNSPGKMFPPSKELLLPSFDGLKLEQSIKSEACEMNSFGLSFDIKGCKKIQGRSEQTQSCGTSFNTSIMSSVSSLPSDVKAMLSVDCMNKLFIKREKMIYYNKIGEFGTAEGHFAEPSGVAVNARNEILVADTNNHRIQVFDENGKFRFKFGDVGRADGQFFFPNRVAVAPKSGDIIITERNPTHQVQIYNQYGQFVRKFGADVLQHPRGITVDNEDRIIIVECKVMKVVIFDIFGKVLRKFGCSKYVEFPNGVAVNDKEEIYISDNRAHCVKVFNYEGHYLRQIGGEGLTNYPISVCINRRGEILIADNHSSFNITIFTQDGQLIKGLESKAKHVQCFDTAILDQGSIVLASKDFRLYLYRYTV